MSQIDNDDKIIWETNDRSQEDKPVSPCEKFTSSPVLLIAVGAAILVIIAIIAFSCKAWG